MIKAGLYDMITDYIENEINYIKKEMSICGESESELSDLMMLLNLTEEDVKEMVDFIIVDYRLEETIDNIIHESIYG